MKAGVPPSLDYTPDPAELQRRIDADPSVAVITARIAELEKLCKQRVANLTAEMRPLREENKRLAKECHRLRHLIRKNDSKIRAIGERSHKPSSDLAHTKHCLKQRKKKIKEMYVKQLVAQAREQLNRTLPINPVLAKPSEIPEPVPPVPTNQT